MAKLKLNLNPTFSADVDVTIPGIEKPEKVKMVFKYRDQKTFREWLDGLSEQRDENGIVIREAKTFVEAFMDFVAAWPGVDAEYDKETVEAFLGSYPAAYVEIFGQYSKLLFGSRIKN